MDEQGLWKLFFATGLPAAYLAAAGQRQEDKSRWEAQVRTAFRPRIQTV